MTLWYTWQRLKHITARIRTEGVTTPAEWRRLRDVCSTVSDSKREYLYREFSQLFSSGSMAYLFGDWIPEQERPAEEVTA